MRVTQLNEIIDDLKDSRNMIINIKNDISQRINSKDELGNMLLKYLNMYINDLETMKNKKYSSCLKGKCPTELDYTDSYNVDIASNEVLNIHVPYYRELFQEEFDNRRNRSRYTFVGNLQDLELPPAYNDYNTWLGLGFYNDDEEDVEFYNPNDDYGWIM